MKLALYYGIGQLLLLTRLSTMVARTLPIWYDLQHQPSSTTSLVGTWGNTNLVAMIFLVANFFDLAKNTFQWIFSCKFLSSKKNLSRNCKIWNFTKNHHNCLQHESVLKIFFLKFIVWILPNLAKYSYGWSALEQHHKIGILSCTSVVWVSIYQAYTWLCTSSGKLVLDPIPGLDRLVWKYPISVHTMKNKNKQGCVCVTLWPCYLH